MGTGVDTLTAECYQTVTVVQDGLLVQGLLHLLGEFPDVVLDALFLIHLAALGDDEDDVGGGSCDLGDVVFGVQDGVVVTTV